jgi:ABC-2 type transport system permease protein
MLVPLAITPLIYDVKFLWSPWLLIVLPLSALAMSAFGIAAGSITTRVEIVQMLTSVLMFVVLLGAPILIPNTALPAPLRALGAALPPTYAAAAIRSVLSGVFDSGFYIDVTILLALTVVSLLALERFLKW